MQRKKFGKDIVSQTFPKQIKHNMYEEKKKHEYQNGVKKLDVYLRDTQNGGHQTYRGVYKATLHLKK